VPRLASGVAQDGRPTATVAVEAVLVDGAAVDAKAVVVGLKAVVSKAVTAIAVPAARRIGREVAVDISGFPPQGEALVISTSPGNPEPNRHAHKRVSRPVSIPLSVAPSGIVPVGMDIVRTWSTRIGPSTSTPTSARASGAGR